MSKKIILLALAVVSAALFALPAVASANENHVEGATGRAFTGTGGVGNLTAEGEPTLSCSKTTATGSFSSETTGTVTLTYSGCNVTILGMNLSCRTVGAEAGIIKMENVFHMITIGTTEKAGVLLTPPYPTIICGSGFSERKIQYGGNGLIGTVTSPPCGSSSASATVSFSATGGNQEHKLFTGTTYDLTITTEGGSAVTAGITGSVTVTFNDGVSRKQVCT
jgi:hypothetical protein